MSKTSGMVLDSERSQPNSNEAPRGGVRRYLDSIRANPAIGMAVVATVAAGFGAASSWLTPRGPITAVQALLSMAVAMLVGLAVGLISASRWSLLIAPTAYAIAFELGRIGTVGPTVDMINLASLYGVIAFVLGRVFHGVLVLLPMIVGAYIGVWLAVATGHASARRPGFLGNAWVALSVSALLVLAVSIARPASTAPILGPDGEPLAGGIAELTTVEIGGHDQAMMIRGRDAENPVLLYLTGGPGGADIGAMRRDTGLEQDFVVVIWEERGAGKSYPSLDPTTTITPEQMIRDTIEVTNYLRQRFDQDRIYLVGQSWGSTLGAMAVSEEPELYEAFVGVGQMVSQRETDIMFWEDALAWADRTGNAGLVETLEANGPPPYDNVNAYAPVVSYEHDWNSYPGFDAAVEMPAILFVPEYSFMERVNAFRGFLDTNGTLYPQLQNIDFRSDLTSLKVPYYMVIGEHEARGRAVLATEWFDLLQAPEKEMVVVDGVGHRPNFEKPGVFAELMRRVLAETSG